MLLVMSLHRVGVCRVDAHHHYHTTVQCVRNVQSCCSRTWQRLHIRTMTATPVWTFNRPFGNMDCFWEDISVIIPNCMVGRRAVEETDEQRISAAHVTLTSNYRNAIKRRREVFKVRTPYDDIASLSSSQACCWVKPHYFNNETDVRIRSVHVLLYSPLLWWHTRSHQMYLIVTLHSWTLSPPPSLKE